MGKLQKAVTPRIFEKASIYAQWIGNPAPIFIEYCYIMRLPTRLATLATDMGRNWHVTSHQKVQAIKFAGSLNPRTKNDNDRHDDQPQRETLRLYKGDGNAPDDCDERARN